MGDETRPSNAKLVLRALALALAVSTALSPARALEATGWKTRQSLAIERAGVIKFPLPPATFDAARPGLEDLRLLDPQGREIPFLIDRTAASSPAALRAPRSFRAILDNSTTQLLIETGTTTPLEAITLATPAPAFLKAVRVEASSDGTRWEQVRDGAPVFRQFGAEQLRLELDRRTATHVRLTLDDSRTRPVPFTGATLALAVTAQPAPTAPLPDVRITRREEFADETLLTLDLGAQNVPLASLEFVTVEPLFTRHVSVAVRELRDEAAVERTLASSSIYRVAAEGLPPGAKLEVPLGVAIPSRELLVHIANGDSPPLALDEVRARQRLVWVVFRAPEPGAYTLLTGNPDVAPPRYDLASLAPSLKETTAAALTPGPTEPNPNYRRPDALADTPLLGAVLDPAPWSYRKAVRLTGGGVQQLELDLDVLARAQPGFADLRLVRDGAQVPYLLERPALSRSTPLPFTPAKDPKRPRFSRWEIKLPRARLPLTRLTLTSPAALFQRHLRLFEAIADDRNGRYERTLADADWSRTPGHDRPLVLTFASAPTTATLWLETDNGDNPPLALGSVTATYPVTRLLFKAGPGALALYYGNRETSAPRYDVTLVAGQILSAAKNVATLDEEVKAKPEGWAARTFTGNRAGLVFWGALSLVVIVLLVAVARLLPKPPGSSG